MTTGPIKPFAFVLMPFSSEYDDTYRLGIKPSCEDAGFIAERVDEQKFSESILERIYRQISAADVIIAVMSDRNPNVFYEVGYAHALEKQCVLVTNTAGDIPFDLKHHKHIVYGESISILKNKLTEDLVWQKEQIAQRKSKALQLTVRRVLGILKLNEYVAKGDVEIDVDLNNSSQRRIREVEAIYLHTGQGWTFFQGSDECPSDVSALDTYSQRHFLKSPVNSLSKGAWAPLKLLGKKTLATIFNGGELKNSYKISGHLTLEVVTSQGTFREKFDIDVSVDEIPF